MKHVFGPVHSRRLGWSLGIDTVSGKKCNWNCVYCQLGRTEAMTNARGVHPPADEILDEVMRALAGPHQDRIEWLTFCAAGEGTLHGEIGWLIQQVKNLANLPVAVITNGSLLYLPIVREALCPADAVLPSLNAGSEALYRRIHRPHPALTFDRHLQGLIDFRRDYAGRLWVEVMLMRGINDTEDALWDLAAALDRVEPEEIHLTVPTRPAAESWVAIPDAGAVKLATRILGGVAQVRPPDGPDGSGAPQGLREDVLGIVRRHPVTAQELEASCDAYRPREIRGVLDALASEGVVRSLNWEDAEYWTAASSRYGEEKSNPCFRSAGPISPIGGRSNREVEAHRLLDIEERESYDL